MSDENDEQILQVLKATLVEFTNQGALVTKALSRRNVLLWCAVAGQLVLTLSVIVTGAVVYTTQDKRLTETVVKLEANRVATELKFCNIVGLSVPRPDDPPAETEYGQRFRDASTDLYRNLNCKGK